MERSKEMIRSSGSGGASAFFKTVSRSIKSTLNRYLSIILIVGIGGGFFAGVKATAPSMRQTAENYFEKYSLMDLEVLSTVGFSEEDAREVEKLDHIKDAMVGYSVDLIMENDESSVTAKVYSLHGGDEYTKGVNDMHLLEGRYPEDYNECIIAAKDYNNHLYKIGDKISFAKMAGATDVDTLLSCREYTVVGIVKSPMYFSYQYGTSSVGSGNVDIYLMIPPVNFLYSRYTELFITLDCADNGISAFSDEYYDTVDSVTKALSKLGAERYAEFVEQSQSEISSAEDELNQQVEKANDELGKAQQQLEDAKKQLDGFSVQLESGWEDYYASKEQVEKQLLDAYQQLVDGENEIKRQEETLKAGKRDYEVGIEQYDRSLVEGRQKLDDGWREYEAGLAEYNAGLAEYNTNYAAYREAADLMANTNATIDSIYALIDNDDPFNFISFVRTSASNLRSSRDSFRRNIAGMIPDTFEYITTSIAINLVEGLITSLENIITLHDTNTGSEFNEYMKNVYRDIVNSLTQSAQANNAQLKQAKAELDAAKAELDAAKKELNAAKTELEAGEIELVEGTKSGKAELEKAKKEIEDGEKLVAEAKVTLAESKKAYEEAKASAEKELASALQELQSAEDEFNGYKSEYDGNMWIYSQRAADANAKIEDAQARISSAKLQLSDIEEGKWYVFTRDDRIQNYSSLIDDSARIDSMMTIFPLFFLLVAALVCLTTMSRMVDEERGQIGTFKSLGYSNAKIVSKYVIYAGSAAVIGIILGEIVCLAVLPKAVFGAYKLMYDIPDFTVSVSTANCLIAFVVGIVCTAVVAWYCCSKELKSAAATLMRPKAPPAGKQILLERIKWIWDKMGFFKKVTARNLFRYKARLVMTVIGITGCMTLLVSGFGMQDSINPLVDLQFSTLSDYDFSFIMQKAYTKDEVAGAAEKLKSDSRVEALSFASGEYGTASNLEKEEKFKDVQLVAYEDQTEFEKIYRLKDPHTGEKIRIGDGDVVITQKLSEKMGVKAGDKMIFTADDVDYEMTVSGITEYYVYHFVFMNANTYADIFGEEAKFNCIFMRGIDGLTSSDLDVYASEVLANNPDIIQATNVERAASIFNDCIEGLRKVVYIMIISAGMLAFVVLYNLTNINISERVREIATIKVLGFKNNETDSYIFRENIIMSLMGTVLGCFSGYILANYIVLSTEVENIMFYRHIEPMSYVYAAALTVLFTFCVNLIMSFKIKKIQMVESLKAVE